MPIVSYSEFEKERSNEDSIYLRLEEGENKVRIVTKPYQFKKTFRESDGPRVRYGWAVIDRSDPKKEDGSIRFKYLEVGPMIYGQVVALVNDEDYGDPKEYDIKIKKTKTGDEKFDVEYHVIPGPKSPLSVEERAALKAFKPQFGKFFAGDEDSSSSEDIDPDEVPF